MAAEAGPSSSCSARVTTGGAAAGVKRKTQGGPTPPQAAKKKPKRGPSLGHTFKQAQEEDLLGVVMIKYHPYTTLARAHVDWIWRQLLVKLEEAIDAGGTAPTFQESGVRQNRFHLSCTDRESSTGCMPRLDQWLYRVKVMNFPCSWYPPWKYPNSSRRRCIFRAPHQGRLSFSNWFRPRLKGYTQIGGFSGISRLQTGVS